MLSSRPLLVVLGSAGLSLMRITCLNVSWLSTPLLLAFDGARDLEESLGLTFCFRICRSPNVSSVLTPYMFGFFTEIAFCPEIL